MLVFTASLGHSVNFCQILNELKGEGNVGENISIACNLLEKILVKNSGSKANQQSNTLE